MSLFQQQLDQLIQQSDQLFALPLPTEHLPAEQSQESLLPPTVTAPSPEDSPPELESSNEVDLVWFDRGINLDEIELQSAYRNRRKIGSLDG